MQINEEDYSVKINLNQLNSCIEENINNLNCEIENYDFIKFLTEMMAKKIKRCKLTGVDPIILFSREKSISEVLKFFQSLKCPEWYNLAKGILLGQDKNKTINIYDYQEINSTDKDENNFDKYSDFSCIEYKGNGNPNTRIKVLLKEGYEDILEFIDKDKFTLDDLQTIAHEIAHNLDFNPNEENSTRDLLSEIPAFCIEKMFLEYLKEKNIIIDQVLEKMQMKRLLNSCEAAESIYAKILLMETYEEDGKLTKENIQELLKECNITNPNEVRRIFINVVGSLPDINYEVRYPIAELSAIEYMKKFRANKSNAIRRLKIYCNNAKRGNFTQRVLKLVGCPINSKDINKRIKDINNQQYFKEDDEEQIYI